MRHEDSEKPLIGHLEKYLGRITGGWSGEALGGAPFQIALFEKVPIRDCVGYVTVGLSEHEVRSRVSGKPIRQELMIVVRGGVPAAADLLRQIGQEIVGSGSPLLRGDIVGPRGPLWSNSRLEAFYAALPVYFPDALAECDLGGEKKCAIVWLIPISRNETAFVGSHGWAAFERLLVRSNPDLLLTDRAEVDGLCPP